MMKNIPLYFHIIANIQEISTGFPIAKRAIRDFESKKPNKGYYKSMQALCFIQAKISKAIDLSALTSGHFLTGGPILAPRDPNTAETSSFRRKSLTTT